MYLHNTAETLAIRRLMAGDTPMADIGGYHVEPGDNPPELAGKRRSWHYETSGGSYIRHPSAYSKVGWSNMVYCPAQRYTVTCGIDWLRDAISSLAERRAFRTIFSRFCREAGAGKTAARRAARATSTLPLSLSERLADYKRRTRRAALEAAGFSISTNGCRVDHYFIGHPSYLRYGAWPERAQKMFSPLPTPAQANFELAMIEADSRATHETWVAKNVKEYDAQVDAVTPQGRVLFDAEGGFRVSNN